MPSSGQSKACRALGCSAWLPELPKFVALQDATLQAVPVAVFTLRRSAPSDGAD